jgi:hypothetical protein
MRSTVSKARLILCALLSTPLFILPVASCNLYRPQRTYTNILQSNKKSKKIQDYFYSPVKVAQVNIIIYLCIVKPTKPSYDQKAKSTIQNDSTTNRYEFKKR